MGCYECCQNADSKLDSNAMFAGGANQKSEKKLSLANNVSSKKFKFDVFDEKKNNESDENTIPGTSCKKKIPKQEISFEDANKKSEEDEKQFDNLKYHNHMINNQPKGDFSSQYSNGTNKDYSKGSLKNLTPESLSQIKNGYIIEGENNNYSSPHHNLKNYSNSKIKSIPNSGIPNNIKAFNNSNKNNNYKEDNEDNSSNSIIINQIDSNVNTLNQENTIVSNDNERNSKYNSLLKEQINSNANNRFNSFSKENVQEPPKEYSNNNPFNATIALLENNELNSSKSYSRQINQFESNTKKIPEEINENPINENNKEDQDLIKDNSSKNKLKDYKINNNQPITESEKEVITESQKDNESKTEKQQYTETSNSNVEHNNTRTKIDMLLSLNQQIEKEMKKDGKIIEEEETSNKSKNNSSNYDNNTGNNNLVQIDQILKKDNEIEKNDAPNANESTKKRLKDRLQKMRENKKKSISISNENNEKKPNLKARLSVADRAKLIEAKLQGRTDVDYGKLDQFANDYTVKSSHIKVKEKTINDIINDKPVTKYKKKKPKIKNINLED